MGDSRRAKVKAQMELQKMRKEYYKTPAGKEMWKVLDDAVQAWRDEVFLPKVPRTAPGVGPSAASPSYKPMVAAHHRNKPDPSGPEGFHFSDGELITVVENCVTAVVDSFKAYKDLFDHLNVPLPTFMDFSPMSDYAKAIRSATHIIGSEYTEISDLVREALKRVAASMCAWGTDKVVSKVVLAVKQDLGGIVAAKIDNISMLPEHTQMSTLYIWISSAEGEEGTSFSGMSRDAIIEQKQLIEDVASTGRV